MTCCYESKINDSDKKVILVCDDSKLQLKSMQRALSKHYHVITASSGYEAVAFASLYAPDLVILDITMYGMSGYEACVKIKHNPLTKNIPIVFVTAHGGNQFRDRGIAELENDRHGKRLHQALGSTRNRGQNLGRNRKSNRQRVYLF